VHNFTPPAQQEETLMSRYEGRVVVVTGSARGIGAATARRFADEGASVAVLDLDQEAAASTADGLSGGKAVGVACNVGDAASVEAAVVAVVEQLGTVDILVNNAGVTRDNLLFKMTEDDWDAVMTVHLRGSFLMSREVQKHMVARKYGKILNLSSVSALGNRGQANYSTAKMGLQGFTRTLALELGPFGINVNAIAPGFIVTDMTDATARRVGMEPEDYRKAAAASTPVRRVGHPEDIAATAAFLCSEEASFITGQTLYVDGGARV
jgi:3-oxoacyl-[acyl-carrier protein] reductase